MKFIDCSACIGKGGINRRIVNHENYIVTEKVSEPETAAELLAEMDYCGVDEAILYHQAMIDVSAQYGNGLLENELKSDKSKRLRGTITVLPSISDAGFDVADIQKKVRELNLAGVRAFPHNNRFMLDKVTCGDLLDYLTQSKLPLYLTPADGWEHIFAVLKEFPKLTVIITNYGLWGSDRYFYPLARAYKNVHIDTGDFQVIRGLEAFVGKFGSERLLFGTNYPMDNMGGPIAALLGAKISLADKENIAHGNIERILGGVAG
ncbi:hypothetical protein FACS1894211_14120 [Clostridia bacterium]|nr:hypothetical protein FACS1894211_14120 [Clostridia bacterium]